MKRLFFLLAMLAAMNAASADNYFTMGENDTLRIKPANLGGYQEVPVRAHFEGRLNYWYLTFGYPGGLKAFAINRKSGMNVHYLDSIGADKVIQADYTNNLANTTMISYISVIGFWDYNGSGNYAPYGKVKWEAGDYDPMFSILFEVSDTLTCGTISIDGYLTSSDDARGGTVVNYSFYKCIDVIVGYKRGDVDGDGSIDIDDVSAIVNYLLTDEGLDQYQLEAADFNQDGFVTIDDVTALTNYLLTA